MCGICGIISSANDIERDNLQKMCNRLAHRGPDGEGIYISQGRRLSAGLGHRRLSIIDLSDDGSQPMSNEDSSIWLVLNGEIYNYLQLRSELIARGHRFKSKTDSEVVLHLYEDFGEDCVSYLRGMFAFTLWDKEKDKLLLARDRVGKKPLLYYYDGRHFCFASEFRALLASNLISKDINYEAINQYLTFGYVPAPNTIYKKVFKILPAHYGIFQDGNFYLKKYWDLDYSDKIVLSQDDAASELVKILKEAVRLRLISDVPLGIFLSGGIDSSAMVALMSELTGKVKTFSIGFEDEDYNELQYARNVARYFSTDHHEFIVRPNALEILPLLVEHYGEPFADSSAIPTYYVARETKQFVTVALNGDGGDESFAGYDRYYAMALADKYNRLPEFLRNSLRQALIRILPDSFDFKNKRRRLRRFLENVSNPFYARYCRWISMIGNDEKEKLYSRSFKGQLNNTDFAGWLSDLFDLPNNIGLADHLMAIDIKTNLANDLLVKMDIATMANSLEGRSPFLDQEVMQFAAALPPDFKLRSSVKKYILKKSIRKLLPPGHTRRPKMGFGIPVGRWMKKELRDYIKATLLSSRALKRGYFSPGGLKDYVEQHLDGKKDHTSGLWTLLMLELWHQRFID